MKRRLKTKTNLGVAVDGGWRCNRCGEIIRDGRIKTLQKHYRDEHGTYSPGL